LATYKKGPFGSSLTKGMFVPQTTPYCIKVYEQKNAIQHDAGLGEYFITQEKFGEMKSFKTGPGDFIVSCAGTIGEIFKLPFDAPIGIINQALMKIELFNEDISDYFELLLFSKLHELSGKSKGTAIKNIPPFDVLKPAKIMMPPLREQTRILLSIKKLISQINLL
jgi:type I restriction enzyme S subunit